MVRMALLYPLKIGVLSLLFWYLLRARLPGAFGVAAAIVLAVLFHIAIVGVLTSRRRMADSRRLKNSVRGEVPRDGQRIAVSGTIEAEGDLLTAPISGKPCLLYSYEIFRIEHVQSRSGSGGSTRRVVDYSGLAMVPSTIRSSNGRFALCAFPYLPAQRANGGHEAAQRERAREYIKQTTFEKTLPYAGELAALDRAMAAVGRSIRVDSQMRDGDQFDDAKFEEESVSDGAHVCAFGVYSAAEHGLIPGRGAEERIRLVMGEAPEVLKGLASGARASQVLATVMTLIVGAVVAFVLLAPPEMIERLTG